MIEDLFWTYQSLIYAIGVNGLLALSMYAVLAIGQLSLAQAAFMGIGAYSSALLTVKLGTPFPLALLAAMAIPALAALVIFTPTLRLSGVYLALATIGFGEVLRIFLVNAEITGGAGRCDDHLRRPRPGAGRLHAGRPLAPRPGDGGDPPGRGRGRDHGHQAARL
jgi:ABC-type branched-subunit amino acid transport system permease subunit